jgi:MraZ protein
MMWIGEFSHSLDEKNRCVLPSKFRQLVKDKKVDRFFITRGFEGCIAMYEESEWTKLVEKLSALNTARPEVRNVHRLIFGSAAEVVPDAQGRFVIPDPLREYAGIGKDIVTLGVSNRIEIWSKDHWNKQYEQNRENLEKMAENLVF